MNKRASRPEAWFEKAEHDLVMIRKAMVGEGVPWDMVTFHAQQAAEKYLKGFEALASLRSGCIELTDAGYQARYPDASDPPGEDTAKHAIEIARRISDAIRERVPKSGAP